MVKSKAKFDQDTLEQQIAWLEGEELMRSMKKITLIVTMVIVTMFALANTKTAKAAGNGTWVYSGGGWWYSYADGSYATNEYINGYWLNSAGWYDSTWNGGWYRNSVGWWYQSGYWYPVNQWLKIDQKWYHFNASGYMDANQWIGDYYVGSSGAMATNQWVGNYYVNSSGMWVRNQWIGDYYVGADGLWVPGKQKTTDSSNKCRPGQNVVVVDGGSSLFLAETDNNDSNNTSNTNITDNNDSGTKVTVECEKSPTGKHYYKKRVIGYDYIYETYYNYSCGYCSFKSKNTDGLTALQTLEEHMLDVHGTTSGYIIDGPTQEPLTTQSPVAIYSDYKYCDYCGHAELINGQPLN